MPRRKMMATAIGLALMWLCPPMGAKTLEYLQDPNDAIFSATDVVIVASAGGDDFKVEQSLLGSAKDDQTITLPGFKLLQWKFPEDRVAVPITGGTRILLFLHTDPHDAGKLQIAEDGMGYFYRDVGQVDDLRQLAEKAIAEKKKWDAIVAMKPSMAKVEALWPYVRGSWLSDSRRMTLAELSKMKPLAGDYLADRLPWYKPDERVGMMQLYPQIPSQNLRGAIIADMQGACAAVDVYLAEEQRDNLDGDLPGEIDAARQEIGSGLSAITKCRDPNDLPLVRDTLPWLLRTHCDGAVGFCTEFLRDCPDQANIPILKAVWEHYRPSPHDDHFPYALINTADALGATGSRDAIPILQDMLTYEGIRPWAQSALDKILHR
jgi:hypothetical protein